MPNVVAFPGFTMSPERRQELDEKSRRIRARLVEFIQAEFEAADFSDTLTGPAVLVELGAAYAIASDGVYEAGAILDWTRGSLEKKAAAHRAEYGDE